MLPHILAANNYILHQVLYDTEVVRYPITIYKSNKNAEADQQTDFIVFLQTWKIYYISVVLAAREANFRIECLLNNVLSLYLRAPMSIYSEIQHFKKESFLLYARTPKNGMY